MTYVHVYVRTPARPTLPTTGTTTTTMSSSIQMSILKDELLLALSSVGKTVFRPTPPENDKISKSFFFLILLENPKTVVK